MTKSNRQTANHQKNEGKLEAGLKQALKAIDNQIARNQQRTPLEREQQGVLKWQAYADRIEYLTEYLLLGIGNKEFDLDGLLVLSQACTKSLSILADDLGTEGLGKVRSEYLAKALADLEQDAFRGRQAVKASALD